MVKNRVKKRVKDWVKDKIKDRVKNNRVMVKVIKRHPQTVFRRHLLPLRSVCSGLGLELVLF
jgi:hypothetical protein